MRKMSGFVLGRPSAIAAAACKDARSCQASALVSNDEIERSGPAPRSNAMPGAPRVDAAQRSEVIEAHVETCIGPVSRVLHEIVSDLVHLDGRVIEATQQRPFHGRVTGGVSDRPLTVPDGLEDKRRVERLIALPAHWPLTMDAFQDEARCRAVVDHGFDRPACQQVGCMASPVALPSAMPAVPHPEAKETLHICNPKWFGHPLQNPVPTVPLARAHAGGPGARGTRRAANRLMPADGSRLVSPDAVQQASHAESKIKFRLGST